MSNIDRPRSNTRPVGPRSLRRDLRTVRRRPSVQLVSDGVVASYIHDISERQHPHARVVPLCRAEAAPRLAETFRDREAEVEGRIA